MANDEQRSTVTATPDAGPRLGDGIRVRDASKVFQTDKGRKVIALESVSLDVAEGEIVSLIGPSGCGKSTLCMLISGLDLPTEGTVHVHGAPVTGPMPDVGMVFQRDLLFDWRTVIQNVLTPFTMRGEPTKPHQERARELLAQVGLGDFENHRPYQLSGGMKQRVALCRGLIQDPRVLLLDEPFAALDALTREQMQIDVQSLWSDSAKTAVLVTHDIGEAVFMSDRVVVMSARPSRVHTIVDINLPRPRTPEVREMPEFGEKFAEIHHIFKELGVLS